MAQPRDYTRQYNFSDYQATSPSDPLRGSEIDGELNSVKLTLDDLNANIAKIQRDDGKLGNTTVHKDAFDQGALAIINSTFTPRGNWATATAYAVNDAVNFNGATYVATSAHTSSAAFATDSAASRWILIANAAIAGTSSAVDKFEGDGSTTAFSLSYSYESETSFLVFVNGELLNPVDDYTLSGSTLTLFTAPGLPTVAGNENVIVWGASVVGQAAKEAAEAAESNASGFADEAESWATKTNGIVESTDYSSKAWATGGTGVDAGSGSAKDWATKTSGTVGNTTEYSSKYWATQGNVPIVATNIGDVNTVAGISSDVTTVSGINANVTTVAGISSDVTTVSGISGNVSTVAGISSDVTTAAGDSVDIQTVASKSVEIGRLGTADAVSDMNTLGTAAIVADLDTLADISTDISTVSGISANVTTVSGINANVTTVAGIASDVTTVAGNTANVSSVAGNSTNINTVAGQATNLQNVTDNLTAIQSASANASAAAASATSASDSAAAAAAAFDSFDDKYLGSKTGYADSGTGPTTDNDGNALVEGSLFFSSDANEMRVYDGANWIAASSAGSASLILYEFTATNGQTTFSGVDDNGATFGYTTGNAQFVLNGVILDPSDYTATNGTSVVLASGAATGDLLNVYAFKSFTVADTVSASAGGTFAGNVTFNGSFTSKGIDDNATSTAMTLDSSGNIGIGTSSPSTFGVLAVKKDQTADTAISVSNAGSASASTTMSFALNESGTTQGWLRRYRDGTGNTEVGFSDALLFSGNVAGSKTERMRIESGGALLVTSNDIKSSISGTYYLSGANGTAGNPSYVTYSFVDDANTGMYRSGADTLNFATDATERMRIDSSGNVGIGNSNPSAFNTLGASDKLVIGDSTDSNLTLFGTTYGSLAFADSDTSSSTAQYAGLIQYYHADNSMQFYTNSSERMRITTDKVQFNVDAKVDADNSHDLGSGGARWKDLYLSGGVYLGGTGAANKLDDYEEGTFNPTIGFRVSATGSLSYTRRTFRYIKVGSSVFITGFLTWYENNFTANSGAMQLQGLPFAFANSQEFRGGVNVVYSDATFTGVTIYQQGFRNEQAETNMVFNFSDTTDGAMDSTITSYTSIPSGGSMMISGTYTTT